MLFRSNDVANPFDLTFLDLNTGFGANAAGSGFAGLAITGNPLRFVQQGLNLPTIIQGGAAVRIGTNLQFNAATTIGGAGARHLLIDGTLSGAAWLTVNRTSNGGQTILSADNSGWAGGITLQGGILALGNALGSGTLTAAGGQLRMALFSAPRG